MDTTEIQKRVNTISDMMVVKGLPQPYARFEVQSHAEFEVTLRRESVPYNKYSFHKADNAEVALKAAEAYIAALPDATTNRRNAFIAALGAVIDQGRDAGIEIDFINSLIVMMKRLSKNAITDQSQNEMQF